MVSRVLFSSNTDEYETPQELFNELDNEFNFNLDPCSTVENRKCSTHYTKEDNGLTKDWGGYSVFCNPPYSNIKEWAKKCYEESLKPNTKIVLLVPSRTDTKWFHEYVYGKAELRFIKGRLKFGESKGSAPFPSMIAIFETK